MCVCVCAFGTNLSKGEWQIRSLTASILHIQNGTSNCYVIYHTRTHKHHNHGLFCVKVFFMELAVLLFTGPRHQCNSSTTFTKIIGIKVNGWLNIGCFKFTIIIIMIHECHYIERGVLQNPLCLHPCAAYI